MAPWLPLGIGMKSLDPLSDLTLVQWILGSSWCTTMLSPHTLASCGESMCSWRMKEQIPWPPRTHWMAPMLTWPKSNRTPLGHCFGPSNAARLHLRLSRSSVMPWSRSGRIYPRTFTFMHLAFIQSDLQCIQAIHFFHYVCSLATEPTTCCNANAMLYHWATGTLYIRCLTRSMPWCCQACIQACGGQAWNYCVPFWVAAMKFQQNG